MCKAVREAVAFMKTYKFYHVRLVAVLFLCLLVSLAGCKSHKDGGGSSAASPSPGSASKAVFNQEVIVFAEEDYPDVRFDYETNTAYFAARYEPAFSNLTPGRIIAVTTPPGFMEKQAPAAVGA